MAIDKQEQLRNAQQDLEILNKLRSEEVTCSANWHRINGNIELKISEILKLKEDLEDRHPESL